MDDFKSLKEITADVYNIINNDAVACRFGTLIVNMLALKPAVNDEGKAYSPHRYDTEWGTKTTIGLARSIVHLLAKL